MTIGAACLLVHPIGWGSWIVRSVGMRTVMLPRTKISIKRVFSVCAGWRILAIDVMVKTFRNTRTLVG